MKNTCTHLSIWMSRVAYPDPQIGLRVRVSSIAVRSGSDLGSVRRGTLVASGGGFPRFLVVIVARPTSGTGVVRLCRPTS